jgi:hypothetical protein
VKEIEMTKRNFLIITGLASFILLVGSQLQQPANGWPAGTTEAQKEKIMTVTSDDELTVEESGIADDRVYEIFDAFSPDTQEYKDLIECGFVDKYAFEVSQCWENKGHSVR